MRLQVPELLENVLLDEFKPMGVGVQKGCNSSNANLAGATYWIQSLTLGTVSRPSGSNAAFIAPQSEGPQTAGKAAGYLVGERDAMGREREGVEVLRGDPDMMAAVADSLEFERKYRSIVIAWAPEDRPGVTAAPSPKHNTDRA